MIMGSENDASSLHLKKLEKYCRVCAKVIKERETAHLCSENKELLKTFNIDTTTDKLDTHPKCTAINATPSQEGAQPGEGGGIY